MSANNAKENASLLQVPLEVETPLGDLKTVSKWRGRIVAFFAVLVLASVAAVLFAFVGNHGSSNQTRERAFFEAETYDHDRSNRSCMIVYASGCGQQKASSWNCKYCDEVEGFVVYKVLHPGNNTRIILGYDELYSEIVIAMAGSQNIDNYVSNVQFFLIPYSDDVISDDYGALVHKGFWDIFENVQGKLMKHLANLVDKYSDTTLIRVTGHSMGAAVTAIASIKIKYTYPDMNIIHHGFGSPRWGNAVMAMYWTDSVDQGWRVVHGRDPIATLPTQWMGYHHVGQEVWYFCCGQYADTGQCKYKVCDGSGEDPWCVAFAIAGAPGDHHSYMAVDSTCSNDVGYSRVQTPCIRNWNGTTDPRS